MKDAYTIEVKDIAQLVRLARAKRGETQEEFAQYLGVRQSAVSKWENDEAVPNGTNLYKIIRILRNK